MIVRGNATTRLAFSTLTAQEEDEEVVIEFCVWNICANPICVKFNYAYVSEFRKRETRSHVTLFFTDTR